MKYVFPALDRRFERDRLLKKLGRKLFLGSVEEVRVTHAYVELTVENVSHEFDTFDTDEPVYDLMFTAYPGRGLVDRCWNLLDHLKRVYKDANVESGYFKTSGCPFVSSTTPELIDGAYRGSISFALHVTMNELSPATRFV